MDTLGVKELYSLKHETGNRALNAKMLSSLYAKPTSLAVQVGREGVAGVQEGREGGRGRLVFRSGPVPANKRVAGPGRGGAHACGAVPQGPAGALGTL